MKKHTTTPPPSLTVLGTTTAKDDVMIDAIAQGMAEGEAARKRKGIGEMAGRNPGYTPPHPDEIDELTRVLAKEPGVVPGHQAVTDYEQRYRIDPAFRCGVDAVVMAKTGKTLRSLSTGSVAQEHAFEIQRKRLELAWRAGSFCPNDEDSPNQDRWMREDIDRILAGDLQKGEAA